MTNKERLKVSNWGFNDFQIGTADGEYLVFGKCRVSTDRLPGDKEINKECGRRTIMLTKKSTKSF